VTFGKFISEFRKKIPELKPEQAIFVFVGTTPPVMPTTSLTMRELEKYKDRDGILYVTYCVENVFG
jgi:hypothetical protein